ncbi:MAG TPA: methyl-accepting chemotaxis protein [Sphingomonas sp.]|nr:methyl-accepting chemotaxis protein [Sphingomonas sp.]
MLRMRVRIGAAALIGLLCVGALLASWRIDTIRIGGPLQTRLQQASDLIADILPPPAYVIESYLEATLLVNDPGSYAEHAANLARLHRDYDARHVYWLESDLDATLKRAITADTHAPAQLFWRELERRMLPAVRAGDATAARASYVRLTAAYAAHRSAVDRTVTQAVAAQQALTAQAGSALRSAIAILVALALAIIAVALVSAFYLLRRFVVPLGDMASATTTLAAGGTCAVPHLGRPDELGTLAVAVDRFRRAATDRQLEDARAAAEQQAVAAVLAESLQAMAAGDLSAEATAPLPPQHRAIGRDLDTAIVRLSDMIEAVVDSSGHIDTASAEIAAAAEDLAGRTQRGASELEQTARALGEVDTRLKATTRLSTDAADRAGRTNATVGAGRDSARGAVAAMERVSGSAEGIDEVIGGLDKIAFQTRVLAMNAAIEAGRGGEAGRGFAIVADLVGALAIRAEAEARQARDRLTVTQRDIVVAVGAVADVDAALVAIAQDIDEVQTMLGSIARDNRAQSASFSDVAGTVATMDRTTQQNAAMVEQTSAAARRLAEEVGALVRRTAAFRTRRAAAVPAERLAASVAA